MTHPATGALARTATRLVSRRRVALLGVVAALALVVPVGRAAHGDAPAVQVSASTTQGKPGAAISVHGVASQCALQPFSASHNYMRASDGEFVGQSAGNGSAGPDGSFSFSTTIPTDAARSDMLYPLGPRFADRLIVTFPGCGQSGGVLITVLPISRNVAITLDPVQPVSGQQTRITITNCLGGTIAIQTGLVDNRGIRYQITGSFSGTTFSGVIDLAHGYQGRPQDGGEGPAAVSSPPGALDSAVVFPCTQSALPQKDTIFQSDAAVDTTVRAPGQPLTPPPTGDVSAGAYAVPHPVPPLDTTITTAQAGPATPIAGEPTYAG
jgi:hypothetical protein